MLQIKCDVCGEAYKPIVTGTFTNPKEEGSVYAEKVKLSMVIQTTNIQYETQEVAIVSRDICPQCAKKLMDTCHVDTQGARNIYPLLNRFFDELSEN